MKPRLTKPKTTSDFQNGVASMAGNCRSAVTWSRECLARGDSPAVVLDRMDCWLKTVIEDINPPKPCNHPATKSKRL